MRTLTDVADDLAAGRTTSRALVEECLARIADPQGEGARVFLKVAAETARAAADWHDAMRRHGAALGRYAGIPISIKDLFDIAGEVTTAGSRLFASHPPAAADAPAVARLRSAGFIPIGRTNMTEFAYSGLGLNPHYGTPRNPYERTRGRVPGGSSAGAAVSVTDGMAFGALGTDTGGSCRIPAALCGIVGFKPTAARVPMTGAVPLSTSLDSGGPLAASVSCCAILDGVLAGEARLEVEPAAVAGLRLAVPQTYVLDGLDPQVAAAFEAALGALAAAGARIAEIALPELDEIPAMNAKGGIAAAEAFAYHRRSLAAHEAAYDPRVASRLLKAKVQDAADYIEALAARADLIRRVAARTIGFDALVAPTSPIVAPTFDDVANDVAYARVNALVLRNPAVANLLDRCACSIPCHPPGTAPVGLMLMGERGADRRLLAVAAALEPLVSPRRAA